MKVSAPIPSLPKVTALSSNFYMYICASYGAYIAVRSTETWKCRLQLILAGVQFSKLYMQVHDFTNCGRQGVWQYTLSLAS